MTPNDTSFNKGQKTDVSWFVCSLFVNSLFVSKFLARVKASKILEGKDIVK